MTKNKNNQAIWNARIKKKPSSLFQKVGNSIDIDKRLLKRISRVQLFMLKCYLNKKLFLLKLKIKSFMD